MAQQASERIVNGIKTRVLHGKDYVEVAERVRIVQHDEEAHGFSMISQERYEWGGRYFISVTIELKGKRYIGDAEVTFSAPKNTPAGASPLETAQTSALGRALAFAGFGTVDSIASFDEVYRATYTVEEANGNHVIEAGNAPKQLPAGKSETPADRLFSKQVADAKNRAVALNVVHDANGWSALLDHLKIEDIKTAADLARVNGYLTNVEKRAAEKASAGK